MQSALASLCLSMVVLELVDEQLWSEAFVKEPDC